MFVYLITREEGVSAASAAAEHIVDREGGAEAARDIRSCENCVCAAPQCIPSGPPQKRAEEKEEKGGEIREIKASIGSPISAGAANGAQLRIFYSFR